MKILVCMKQVPDMESKFTINAEGVWFDQNNLAYRINEYDEFAVEQAVQFKEQLGEADVTVLSIGPDRVKEAMKKALAMGCDRAVKEAMKKALAMGCDRAVHIRDDAACCKDSFEIASLIAAYAKDKGFDLVLTGMQSQDRGSAQVGVMLAEMLGLPAVTTIVDFTFEDGTLTLRRELEGGLKAVVKTGLPALVTCQLGLNVPRYPTLPNIMKAKKKEVLTVAVEDLAKADRRLSTEKMFVPDKKGGGLVLEGDAPDLARQLMGLLREKTGVV